jgi:hypothetical protein
VVKLKRRFVASENRRGSHEELNAKSVQDKRNIPTFGVVLKQLLNKHTNSQHQYIPLHLSGMLHQVKYARLCRDLRSILIAF